MLPDLVCWGRYRSGFSGSNSICRYKGRAGLDHQVLLLVSMFHHSVAEQKTSRDRDNIQSAFWWHALSSQSWPPSTKAAFWPPQSLNKPHFAIVCESSPRGPPDPQGFTGKQGPCLCMRTLFESAWTGVDWSEEPQKNTPAYSYKNRPFRFHRGCKYLSLSRVSHTQLHRQFDPQLRSLMHTLMARICASRQKVQKTPFTEAWRGKLHRLAVSSKCGE